MDRGAIWVAATVFFILVGVVLRGVIPPADSDGSAEILRELKEMRYEAAEFQRKVDSLRKALGVVEAQNAKLLTKINTLHDRMEARRKNP